MCNIVKRMFVRDTGDISLFSPSYGEFQRLFPAEIAKNTVTKSIIIVRQRTEKNQ